MYGLALDYYEGIVKEIKLPVGIVAEVTCGLGFKAEITCGLHGLSFDPGKLEEAEIILEEILGRTPDVRIKLYTETYGNTISQYAEFWSLDGRNINRYLIERKVCTEIEPNLHMVY